MEDQNNVKLARGSLFRLNRTDYWLTGSLLNMNLKEKDFHHTGFTVKRKGYFLIYFRALQFCALMGQGIQNKLHI